MQAARYPHFHRPYGDARYGDAQFRTGGGNDGGWTAWAKRGRFTQPAHRPWITCLTEAM